MPKPRDPSDPRWLSHQELRRKQVDPEARRRLLAWQLDRLSAEYQKTWDADNTPTLTETIATEGEKMPPPDFACPPPLPTVPIDTSQEYHQNMRRYCRALLLEYLRAALQDQTKAAALSGLSQRAFRNACRTLEVI